MISFEDEGSSPDVFCLIFIDLIWLGFSVLVFWNNCILHTPSRQHGSTAHVHRTRAMLAALFGILGALGKTGAHTSGC